jgi:hypothetical protein
MPDPPGAGSRTTPPIRAQRTYISGTRAFHDQPRVPMPNVTRSQFLKLSAALAGAAGLSKLPFGKASGQPNA